jgi:hypothetical protein
VNDERGRRARLEHREPHDARAPNRTGPALRESPAPRPGERQLVTRHPSHKLVASIYCEVDGLPVEIEPLELSTAGLFVETPTPLSIDSEVEIFLRIGETRFEASGHVVHSVSCEQATQRQRKPGYGLLFTNVDDGARAQLRRGIQALVVQRATAARGQASAAVPTASRSMRAGPAAASGVVRPSSPAVPRKAPLLSRRPAPEVRAPAGESRRPATEVRAPAGESRRPATDVRAPPSESRRPATEVRAPASESRRPATEVRAPAGEPRMAPSDSRKPPAESRRPAAEAPRPAPSAAATAQPSAAPPIDPAELAMLEKLQAELRALDAKTPWAVLGISQGSDLGAAKCAFFAASKRYHPHLYARYRAAEIKTVVTELFIAHKRAYTTLVKSSKSVRQSVVEHAAVPRAPSKQPGPGNK